MEILLNIAWALCSLGLILYWTWSTESECLSGDRNERLCLSH